jgi:hypothetical protein
MQYGLGSLMLVTGAVPPLVALVWFQWRMLLVACVCLTAVALWVWVSYSIARFFGNLVASLMG